MNDDEPLYLNKLATARAIQEAFGLYQNNRISFQNETNYYIDITQYFIAQSEKEIVLEVLSEMETTFSKNPEALKALVYTYQEHGF